MAESFNTYLSFMPYATAEVSHASVAKFLKSLEKQPNDLLFIAREAENSLFTDSAEFSGENLYLMFAQAVAQNKKLTGSREHVSCAMPSCLKTIA